MCHEIRTTDRRYIATPSQIRLALEKCRKIYIKHLDLVKSCIVSKSLLTITPIVTVPRWKKKFQMELVDNSLIAKFEGQCDRSTLPFWHMKYPACLY